MGFSEKEADVYLALHTYGPLAASTLARLTRIKRTSIYDILNGLLARNLVINYRQGAITYFAIDDINKLIYEEKERIRVAESVIRELKETPIHYSGGQIHHYKGMEGYREMYEDILKARPEELMVWVNLDEFYKALDPEREEQWTRERIQRKIFTRLLMQDTPMGRTFQKKDGESYRKTLLTPELFLFKTTCFLYENTITFFDSSEAVTGIRIQHAGFAQMQKATFEMAWTLLSK